MRRFLRTFLTALGFIGAVSLAAFAMIPETGTFSAPTIPPPPQAEQTFPATVADVFPDVALAQAVAAALEMSAKEEVEPGDFAGIRTLAAIGVADLEGIEHIPSLQVLELRHGMITDISPLATLRNLETLILTNNRIADISALEPLVALETLDLSANRLADISALEPLVALEYLNLSGNQIVRLGALEHLIALEELILSDNRISDISALETLTALVHLSLSNNQISDISPLQDLILLERLLLTNNQVSDISYLSELEALEALLLASNAISDISPLADLDLQILSLTTQRISLPPLVYDLPFTKTNILVNRDGTPISPWESTGDEEDAYEYGISHGGVYNAPYITWSDLAIDTNHVYYRFLVPVPVGQGVPSFSGIVTQHLVEPHIVSFRLQGGNIAGDRTDPIRAVPNGASPRDVPENLRREGHNFLGWSRTANGPVIADWETVGITADTVFFARWQAVSPQPIEHLVTFYLRRGHIMVGDKPNTNNPTQLVAHGASPANIPTNIQRADHSFLGWSRTELGPVILDWTSVGITGPTTFYARWQSVQTVPVTFSAQGADPAIQTGQVALGGTYAAVLDAATQPVRAGYTFRGWFTAPEGGIRITSATPVLATTGHTLYAQWREVPLPPEDVPFTDIEDHPAQEAIGFVFNRGLMSGTSPTTFSPETELSRAMAVMVLWRLEGEPEAEYEMAFYDVEADQFYTEAVMWAAGSGIVQGHEGIFDPHASITRGQLSTMLHRYAQYTGDARLVPPRVNLDQFTDAEEVQNWALEAVRWAVQKDLLVEPVAAATTLELQELVTRAQFARVLQQFIITFG